MKIQGFLKKLIEDKSEYILTKEDDHSLKYFGIKTYIFNKLNSSKYRSSATSSDYLQKIKDKIDLCVNHYKPIHILLPFGGIKNFNITTYPHLNYAEVFNMAYLRDYLKPIAKAYKHGVILEYWSGAVFQEKVNNKPVKDTDTYDKEFRALIDYYQKFLPGNFKLIYSRIEDYIPRKTIEHQLDLKVVELKKAWKKQSKEVITNKIIKARRNMKFDKEDKNLNALILNSALYHDAFISECWAYEPARWDEKHIITLGHVNTEGWAIRLRSARGSTVHAWSGIGLLVKHNNEFMPTIFNSSKYNQVESKLKFENLNILTNIADNLKLIPVSE